MLFLHCIRRADSRTLCTAGKRSPINVPMMAMTTSNSTSVNAQRRLRRAVLRGALRRKQRAMVRETPE